jgi:hypothetical protein
MGKKESQKLEEILHEFDDMMISNVCAMLRSSGIIVTPALVACIVDAYRLIASKDINVITFGEIKSMVEKNRKRFPEK